MKTMLNTMKRDKNNIYESFLPIFEDIMLINDRALRDTKFINAMEEYLTKEQCFMIWAQNGMCCGKKFDKDRKAFAAEHRNKPLRERFDIFVNSIGSGYKYESNEIVLDEKTKTITMNFACKHGLMHLKKGVSTSLEAYFGQCAGGRLYELQLALGINLKIKEVDVTSIKQNVESPCLFTFEIAE